MKTKKFIPRTPKCCCILIALMIVLGLAACGREQAAVDYGKTENWVYAETERKDTAADVFFVNPTTYFSADPVINMPLNDDTAKAGFKAAIDMEKGIYDDDARFFAPYYRQAPLNIYDLMEDRQRPYLDAAYEDVSLAFSYYLEHYNDGRPIILAGFSQGAEHCIRLMKDYSDKAPCAGRIIACYAIGWRLIEEDLQAAPYLKAAEGETDTGVIVTFNSEAEFTESTLLVPSGIRTYAINPLSWTTDGTYADPSLNLGACFPNADGTFSAEIPELTGAYLDPVRGTLKVPDVAPEDYPEVLEFLGSGSYHLYDYMFFYRNLEQNVQVRTQAFLG